jgi:hypothetical protein
MIRRLIQEGTELLEDPKWHRPDTSKGGPEHGEIQRTRASLKLKAKDLHAAVKRARLGHLSDKHWSSMSNTESWKANKWDADYYAKKYKRDIKRVYKGYKEGAKMPAPIVLHRPGKQPYCVGGNTRLLAASAVGIRPKVLHVRMKK